MGRKASVRQKNGHWFSEAGGVGRYFGRVDAVSYSEAMAKLWSAIADDGVDRVLEVGDGNGVSANERSTARTVHCGRHTPSLGVRSLVRSSTTPNATASPPPPTPLSSITVAELRDRYLDWLQRHRSPALHRETKRHLQRFCEACGGFTPSPSLGAIWRRSRSPYGQPDTIRSMLRNTPRQCGRCSTGV